jgi:hypothetical protein
MRPNWPVDRIQAYTIEALIFSSDHLGLYFEVERTRGDVVQIDLQISNAGVPVGRL